MSPQTYYDEYWSPDGYNPTGHLFPELLEILRKNVPPYARCLDVGCGDGRTCGLWLKTNAAEYVGVDVSQPAVAQARALGLDVRLIDDAVSLPFPDASFDVAVCVEVLEHLFLPQAVAAEILRVLSPGGRLIVTVPNVIYWRRRLELAAGQWNPFGDGLSTTQPWRDPHIRFFTGDALRRMLLTSGFEHVEIGGHWGAFIHDLPYIAKLFLQWPRRASAPYRLLQRLAPSFFGLRLHAIAYRGD